MTTARAKRRILRGRALLVATAGAATVVYAGCSATSGNLIVDPSYHPDGGSDASAAEAAAADRSIDARDDFGISSGNLIAPPPPPPPTDAGDGG